MFSSFSRAYHTKWVTCHLWGKETNAKPTSWYADPCVLGTFYSTWESLPVQQSKYECQDKFMQNTETCTHWPVLRLLTKHLFDFSILVPVKSHQNGGQMTATPRRSILHAAKVSWMPYDTQIIFQISLWVQFTTTVRTLPNTHTQTHQTKALASWR